MNRLPLPPRGVLPSPFASPASQPSSTGGIAPNDVAALLDALSRTGPDVIRAVAQMIMAASQGQQINIDLTHLGIESRLLARVLQAAGNSGQGQGGGLPPAPRNVLSRF